jgi:hypothetical protein
MKPTLDDFWAAVNGIVGTNNHADSAGKQKCKETVSDKNSAGIAFKPVKVKNNDHNQQCG